MTALAFLERASRQFSRGRTPGADGAELIAPTARADTRAGFQARRCQWIEGALPDRSRLGRRSRAEEVDACKCGAPVVPGRSYCAEHLERAIRRLPPAAAMRAADRLVARIFAQW